MNNSNTEQLNKHIKKVLDSCKNTSWEMETIKNLKLTLKSKLGIREILIDKLISDNQ